MRDLVMISISFIMFWFGFYLQYPTCSINDEFKAKAAELNIIKGNLYIILSVAILIAVYYKN